MINFNRKNDAQPLTEEESRNNLERLMMSVDEKYRNFNTARIIGKQKEEQMRVEMINKMFDLLESKGIDPSNKEQLDAYIQELKSNSPELYALFEGALNKILSGMVEEPTPQAGEAPPEEPRPGEMFGNLMNQIK